MLMLLMLRTGGRAYAFTSNGFLPNSNKPAKPNPARHSVEELSGVVAVGNGSKVKSEPRSTFGK